MHEAALRAIDYYIARRHEHLLEAINRVVSEDKEPLSRLAK